MNPEAYKQRLISKSIPELIKLATKSFNGWVRSRDEGKQCISCPSHQPTQACHYFSAGHHPALRFNEKNVHLGCVKCNMFLSGNLINYRIGLIKRIGEDEVKKLEDLAAYYKRNGYKWQREVLIETILKYK